MKSNKNILKALVIFFVLCAALSCSKKTNEPLDEISIPIQEAFRSQIRTETAIESYPKQELTLTGKVICDPDQTINYIPLLSGIVEKTYFSLGDKVTKGQVLMDIRSSELSSLQSEQISLETDLSIAQRELQTIKSLFEDHLSSEKEFLEAQGKVRQLEGALKKLETDRLVYGNAKENGIFSVHAPMAGYIINKNISSGNPILPEGDLLFSISDLTSVWVIANVYPNNIRFVKEGMEAQITSVSYPGEIFTGNINHISHIFDSEDKTLKARIELPNKDLKFKPEMAVTIQLFDHLSAPLVAIPSDAIIFDENKYFVVVENNEEFIIRPILPFSHYEKTTYLTEGLIPGEKIVTKNQLLIFSELKGK